VYCIGFPQWIIIPLPTYIPTWLTPEVLYVCWKKIRSPGLALDGETLTCDIDSMKFEFTYKDGKLVLGDKLEFTKMAKKPEV
jgi:hypothetical protein